MTATCAGSTTGLSAKGLDISLAALQRQDPYIDNIVDVASQVALYTFNNRTNEWEKTEIEGTLFVYARLASPRHGFTIMNRLRMENLTEPITKDLDFQLQDPFLLYRNARLVIHGIWFYDKLDCQRIAQKMTTLTQQEQALAQSLGGWLSPGQEGRGGGGGGGGGGDKAVDILQMLTKARSEYDKVGKSSSEPKEIGGSSVLYGNPNLIKPIPVKPNTQDGEGSQPRPLSLATLFGSQLQHQQPLNPEPSPKPAGGPRPGVVRALTYEGPGGDESAPGSAPPQQPQHCPAIQKLVQGHVGAGGVLQIEAPENRLCENGVALGHHHHQQHHHQQQQQQHLHHFLHHQHHLHSHHQPRPQPDPIQRLFQKQPPAPLLPQCCSNPPPLQQPPLVSPHRPTQPLLGESLSYPHGHPQNSQPLFYAAPKPRPETQAGSRSSPAAGVVSPHELLQKLQLVQQEQSLASRDAPHHCPGFAPRFPGVAPNQGSAPSSPASTQNPGLQFQVMSPRRIPSTVASTMLLSPSVFAQNKPSPGGVPVVPRDTRAAPAPLSRPPRPEDTPVLSRSQLQATLLQLIQTDGSFLDSIYDAYVGRLAKDTSN